MYSYFKLIILTLILSHNAYSFTAEKQQHDTAIEQSILIDINAYRQKHFLSPLHMDARIVQQARNHSVEMAQHKVPFGHTDFLKRIKILRKQIKNAGAAAENVAFNYKDAHDVVKNWLLSPGHRKNIEGHYNLTGVGIARDSKGKIYFTQIFLKTTATTPIHRKKTSYRTSLSLPFISF